MKWIMVIAVFLLVAGCATRQELVCGEHWPAENKRSDTISRYFFQDRSLLTKSLPHATPVSNYSFKTPDFRLTWMPVVQEDITDFVSRSIRSFYPREILDSSLQCRLFGKMHKVVVCKLNRKIVVMIYKDRSGSQDFFVMDRLRRKQVPQALAYINTYLD